MDSFASESHWLLFETVFDPVHPQCHTCLGRLPWSSNPGKQGGIYLQPFPLPFDSNTPQDDRLLIDVRNELENDSLDLVTSIVRSFSFWDGFGTLSRICPVYSTGMVSSNRGPTGPMVLMPSPSAPLYQTKAFCIILPSQANRYFPPVMFVRC